MGISPPALLGLLLYRRVSRSLVSLSTPSFCFSTHSFFILITVLSGPFFRTSLSLNLDNNAFLFASGPAGQFAALADIERSCLENSPLLARCGLRCFTHCRRSRNPYKLLVRIGITRPCQTRRSWS